MKGSEVIVKAQKCECCNHHEIGVVDKDGKFVQLKPGMKIIVVEEENELDTE